MDIYDMIIVSGQCDNLLLTVHAYAICYFHIRTTKQDNISLQKKRKRKQNNRLKWGDTGYG